MVPITSLAIVSLFTLASAETFDYVIVGGGAAGCLLANRLSANSKLKIALLEPGTDQRNNPQVLSTSGTANLARTEVDWSYKSIPQPQMNGRSLSFAGGKGFGGSTLINGMAYIRADAAELDSWEQMGNPGWNWNTMNQYYKSTETFFPPTSFQISAGASYNSAYHGTSGAVHTGFNPSMTTGPIFNDLKTAWASLGIPAVDDFNGGGTRGFSSHQQTLDPVLNVRWDAATAFYWPIASRSNIKVFQGPGTRINWKAGTTNGNKVASGIVYHPGGTAQQVTITAKKEIILCAGALRTPLILEQSGIGNAKFLKSLGINSVVDLPGVGFGLNDQPDLGIQYSTNLPGANYTIHTSFVNAMDVFGDNVDAIAQTTRGQLADWAAQLSGGDANIASAMTRLFQMQHDLIFKSNVTVGEVLTMIQSNQMGTRYWPLLPFSRGSVHLKKSGSFQSPAIDAGFFNIDWDHTMQQAIGKFSLKVFQADAAKKYVGARVSPTLDAIPESGATDDQWRAFHRRNGGSISHPMGTAAMRSRDLLGVVNPNLVVYGTQNVRVIDASIFPTEFSGHLSAMVYAVAEIGASKILSGQGASPGTTTTSSSTSGSTTSTSTTSSSTSTSTSSVSTSAATIATTTSAASDSSVPTSTSATAVATTLMTSTSTTSVASISAP